METVSVRIPAAFDFSHPPPVYVRGISILFVASHNAALAADALRHIKVKAILFARFRGSLRDSWWNGRGRDFVQVLLGWQSPLPAQREQDPVVLRPPN
jgi:hypothetical protein